MIHNIHEMLSAYNFDSFNKKSFTRILNSVKNDINMLDTQGNTPILHYCIKQLKSNKKISHEVLHILITQYHADVNIPNNDNMIPLNIIMSLEWTLDKINLIRLLVQYTKLNSLLFNRDQEKSLFQSILLSPVLWRKGIAQDVLDHMTNQHLNKYLDTNLVWRQCQDVLLVSHIKPNIFDILQSLYQYSQYHFDTLLQKATRANNRILVSALLEYSPNINQKNILAYIQRHEKIKEKILQDWHKDNNIIINNVIICNQLINIPDLLSHSIDSNINAQIKKIVQLGTAILKSYMQYLDETILADFGFNNNYFHFIALTSQKYGLNIHQLQSNYEEFANHPHDAINAVNDFGQTPLEIALLCHNKLFISFYSKLPSKNNMPLWDKNGDTILHIMARVHLQNAGEIQSIFQELGLDIQAIIAHKNMLGRNPAYNAVLSGNNIFLQWWIDNGGMQHLSDIDHTHQTLWHVLVHASIAIYSIEDITLDMAFRKQHSEQVLDIYKILKFYIPQQIDQQDALQMTPTHLAIDLGRHEILKLFLQDFDKINLQTKDQSGNTIAHTMANNLIFEPENIAWNIKIVEILKPYQGKINSIYNIKNLHHDRSIDILQENWGNRLQNIISQQLSNELLIIVGSYELYDNIMKFSPQFTNILDKINIQDISSDTLDKIRVLSFEIAYSTVNDWGDTIIHTLISSDLVLFSSDIIVVLILEIIGREMAGVVYNVPNNLGQYILHLAIYKGDANIIRKVLTDNIGMINQPTKALGLNLVALFERHLHHMQVIVPHQKHITSTWFAGFYPADYAMISNHANAVLQVLCDKLTAEQQKNPLLVGDLLDSKYPNDVAQRFPQFYEKYFKKIDIPSSQSDVHDILTNHQYQQLIAIRDDDIRIMMKDFSTLPDTVKSLAAHLNFIYPVRIAKSLEQLEQILWNLLKLQNTEKIILIAIGYSSHVSALVLLFDPMLNQYYVYLQDSSYQGGATLISRAYYERYIAIIKILYDNLHVKKANVYELPITQQKCTDSNCGLWTIANLKIMEQSILQNPKTLYCHPVLGLSKKTIQDKMIHNIKKYAPALEKQLENFVQQVHTQSYAPIKWELKLSEDSHLHMFTLQTRQEVEHMEYEYDKDDVSSYNTIQLSDHNIRVIVHELYASMFDVHTLSEYYDNSNRGLVVVQDPHGNDELRTQIYDFINTHHNQQERSTRTFIINQGGDHWVTLVLSQQQGHIISYFADSYALPMPPQIKSIIEEILPGTAILKHLISIRQQNDNYNCGLWAIENARDINVMLQNNYDLVWLNAQLDPARLNRNDNKYFIEMRTRFRAELEADVHHYSALDILHNLRTQEVDIGLRTFKPICDSKTQSTLERRKRSICNEDIENSRIEHNPLETNKELDVQVREQLYTNVAYLGILTDLIVNAKNSDSKPNNVLNYIRNIGDIFHQNIKDRSEREKTICNKHSTDAAKFFSIYSKEQLLSLSQEIPQHDIPVLLDNGKHSLIVYYEGDHYKLYSQNYNYRDVFYTTKNDINFGDIKKFASAFFAWCSGGEAKYQIFTFNNMFAGAVFDVLKASNMLNPDDVLPDLKILQHKSVKNIPSTAIRQVVFVDNKVPELEMLITPQFFNNYRPSLSVRIDKLHQVLSSTLDQHIQNALIFQVRHNNLRIDDAYLNDIPKNYKEYIIDYHAKVASILKGSDLFTREVLSQLSWDVLRDYINKYNDIAPIIKLGIFENFQQLHFAVSSYMATLNKVIQPLFFIPDLARAYNNHDYKPLVQLGGLMLGDTLASKASSKLIAQLSHILSQERIMSLQQYAQNPIFKLLTLYSIKELHDQLDILPSDSHEYKIIKHHLNEQYATIAIMIADLFVPELSPLLWGDLFLEQLIYSGAEINIKHDLNIPVLESIFMSLGFAQDKLFILIEESNLLKINLERQYKKYGHEILFNLIRIPKVYTKQWKVINSDIIPPNIFNELNEKSDIDKRCILELSDRQNICVTEIEDWRLTKRYHILQNDSRGFVLSNTSYTQSYYKALPALSNITLDLQDEPGFLHKYWNNIVSKTASDMVFIDQIMHNNIKWQHIPKEFLPQNAEYAMYYDPIILNCSFLELLYTQFDAREGNMYINLTAKWIDQVKTQYYPMYVVTIHILRKPYPSSLIFDNEAIMHSHNTNFSLYAPAGLAITARYIIADNSRKCYFTDIASHLSIQCVTANPVTVWSTKTDIFVGTAQVSLQDKKYVTLNLGHCIIGKVLEISSNLVNIDNALGGGHNISNIILDNTTSFKITLRGNINVHHANTDLSISNIAQKHYANEALYLYQKHHPRNMIYTITVPNIAKIFDNIDVVRDAQGMNISFTDYTLGFHWGTTVVNNTLSIKSHDNTLYLCHSIIIEHTTDTLKVDEGNSQTTIQSLHYTADSKLDRSLILTKIYYNSTDINHDNLQELFSILKPMDQLPKLQIFNILNKHYVCGIVMQFQDSEGQRFYHIFPYGSGDIRINDVKYQITQDNICGLYTANNQSSQSKLQYLYSNTTKIIDRCSNETLLDTYTTKKNHNTQSIDGISASYSDDTSSTTVTAHKHRHHHGTEEDSPHYRGQRDIDNAWGAIDHDDLREARDDILAVSSVGHSAQPLGYNIINWIRENILWQLNELKPIKQVKNLLNMYNDKTQETVYDVDLSDNGGCRGHHLDMQEQINKELTIFNIEDNNELSYWDESSDNNVEYDIADLQPSRISSNHYINAGSLFNVFIGNNTNQEQIFNYNSCDVQGNLLLLNLLMHKKNGIKYNHYNDLTKSKEVDTHYAHNLVYSAYAPTDNNHRDGIELMASSELY